MASSNLGITSLTLRDISSFNAGCDDLDEAITGLFTQDVSPPSNSATISTASFQDNVFFLITSTTSPSADDTVTITVPSIKRGSFIIINETGQAIDVEISGQSLDPARVSVGEHQILATDGINVRSLIPNVSQVISGAYMGIPASGDEVWRSIIEESYTLPVGLTGSYGYVRTLPTLSSDFDIKINGVSQGTMTFTPLDNQASFTFSSSVDIVDGDTITIEAPNPQDVTLENVTFTLALEKTI